MRKDNKILLLVSIFLLIFGLALVYNYLMPIRIIQDSGTIRTTGGFFMLASFLLLMAAIGRERARRD